MSFILTRNSNEFVKYLIEGYVENETDIASLSTKFTLGSIVQAIDSGKVFVLTENGWEHLPTLQDKIDTLSKFKKYIGVTTTELETGSTVNPILINGVSTTAIDGDVATYNNLDFVYNGSIWQEAFSALGLLAYKDSAAGTYTPQGTISEITTTVAKEEGDIITIDSVDILPSTSYKSSNKILSFNAGKTITTTTTPVVKSISVEVSQPTFEGIEDIITVN